VFSFWCVHVSLLSLIVEFTKSESRVCCLDSCADVAECWATVLYWMASAFVACMCAEIVTDCASNDASLRIESMSVVVLGGGCHFY
jgi:hypothetical protein